MTFAFYDLETTGLSPAFDQPLQFAAILTDDEFREIERVNLRCRIAPHIIPSPWALAVTGVRPAQLLDLALPTLFEFTQEIGVLIARWSPTISRCGSTRTRQKPNMSFCAGFRPPIRQGERDRGTVGNASGGDRLAHAAKDLASAADGVSQ